MKTIIKSLTAIVLVAGLMLSSCKKEQQYAPSAKKTNTKMETKAAKLRSSVNKALKDFVITFNNNNNQQSNGSGNGYTNSNGINYTTYSTPTATVYSWSDPTTGTSYTLSQSSSSGGGGLGQLSFNGKSFDYSYVLAIKANSGDPAWDGFLNGRDLRGVVAIDGELTQTDFRLRNLAIFLVMTTGGTGTYDFIDWDSNSIGNGDAIGELLDFSDVQNNSLAGMDDAKFYITSNGKIIVAETSFEMASDAKVTDVVSGVEYSIEGSIMFE
jgi:hypothetical protein